MDCETEFSLRRMKFQFVKIKEVKVWKFQLQLQPQQKNLFPIKEVTPWNQVTQSKKDFHENPPPPPPAEDLREEWEKFLDEANREAEMEEKMRDENIRNFLRSQRPWFIVPPTFPAFAPRYALFHPDTNTSKNRVVLHWRWVLFPGSRS